MTAFGHRPNVRAACRPAPETRSRIPFGLCLATVVLFTGILGTSWLVAHQGLSGLGEGAYFLSRIDMIQRYGLSPYSEVEFAYGPLLLLWPMAWVRLAAVLGWSAVSGYYLSTAVLQVLGLGALKHLIERMGLSRRQNIIAFATMALMFLNDGTGTNYVMLRFLVPYLGLLATERLLDFRWSAASPAWVYTLVPAAAAFAGTAFSPEIGLVTFAGVFLYVGWRAWTVGRLRFGWVSGAGILAAVLLWVVYPIGFWNALIAFQGGGNNFPVTPAPTTLLYLATLLWPVTMAIRRVQSEPRNRDVQFRAAVGVMALGLVPGALGRCDAGHVMVDGAGAWLLALTGSEIGVAWQRRLAAALCGTAVLATGIYLARGTFAELLCARPMYRPLRSLCSTPECIPGGNLSLNTNIGKILSRCNKRAQQAARDASPDPGCIALKSQIAPILGASNLTVPLHARGLSDSLVQAANCLSTLPSYRPSYYDNTAVIFSPEQAEAWAADLKRFRFVALSAVSPKVKPEEVANGLRRELLFLQLYPFDVAVRNEIFEPYMLLNIRAREGRRRVAAFDGFEIWETTP
jgi:hypothetical protein